LGEFDLTSSIWFDLPAFVYWLANENMDEERRDECADTKGSNYQGQTVLPQTHSVIY
jgi:hypothetical protein